ncbi:cell division protein FtsQ [Candidatus Pelagibacter ubique]|uniref:Cell division protein FtsQ n=1 Tax=Pelagibacter ubique TaxID=198252 RepID=A0ABX1T2Y2_PELUQ|nr:FtsQ-type POTRA domain-containing protein [Candidatus Pelagibacter ubique]NMN67595.1 cell division protein FtsQ [Candidatus Pelagibacter ubique]
MHQLIDKKFKIIIYLLFLLILSTTSREFIENQDNYFFKINQINIEGLSNKDNLKIYNELNILLYENILSIRKKEIQKIINQHNIIEELSIKKIYPSTIKINIKPTSFIAKLSGSDQLVGENGKLIKDKENVKVLPYIFGEFSSKDFLIFKKKIVLSKFNFDNFKMLYFFPSKRWDILTYDDILIKLPQDNISDSLNLAYKIINSKDFKKTTLIDLRMNNHLITRK